MTNWRDKILSEFTPKVSRLTLVADPDGLLLEEGILQGIRERGFELIPFEDHISFRYAYESKFRSRWDRGEQTDLVVVLRSHAGDLNCLPFDLLQAGRQLAFNLGDIFPNLSYPVIAAMDRGDLHELFDAQQRLSPGRLGDNATKDFILHHVFELDSDSIKLPADLLRILLRRHYRSRRVPQLLDERFLQLLRQRQLFNEWPIDVLFRDRELFFQFLQERWPIFLDRVTSPDVGDNRRKAEDPVIAGPSDLPFDHPDVRVFIDNLFAEGVLKPVHHDCEDSFAETWIRIGITTAPAESRLHRLGLFIETLQKSIPGEEARHTDWFHFARSWAQFVTLVNDRTGNDPEHIINLIKELQHQVDLRLTLWLGKRYAGLSNLPPVPPVMVHHLPRFIARRMADDRKTKVALIVLDGVAMDQWLVIRGELALQQPGFQFRENALFTWIPTLTSVSRQAVFAGKPPALFPTSIHTTSKEPALWAQFWADQGFASNEIVFAKGLGDGGLEGITEMVTHPKVRIIGLIIDTIDTIMHGMVMGTAGMHNQVRQWAQQQYLGKLVDMLLDHDFQVYLTSDHGNIEAIGCGQPAEGAVADYRGERVRIYSDATLRRKVNDQFPSAMAWDPDGLPGEYLALLAPHRQAFVQEKQRTVCHGGISLEELIVPLAQIERSAE